MWTLRQVYTPTGVRLTRTEKMTLTRQFEEASRMYGDKPEVVEVHRKAREYREAIKALGLTDGQVRQFRPNWFSIFLSFLRISFVYQSFQYNLK